MYSTIRRGRMNSDTGFRRFCSAGDSYTDSIFGNLEVMKYTITNGKVMVYFFEKIRLLSGAYSGMISLICKYHSKFYKKKGTKT